MLGRILTLRSDIQSSRSCNYHALSLLKINTTGRDESTKLPLQQEILLASQERL